MEIIQENSKKSFLGHVFSTTEEDKGEMLNVIQYALLGVVPVITLNKFIQKFVPEADPDKSSIELVVEIALQLIIIFIGLILVHRMVVYLPTYSGFKYENLTLTNVVLAFLMIVLSIQSKVGLKANILVDRADLLWNGPSENFENEDKPKKRRGQHSASRADNLDDSNVQDSIFPPAPVASSRTVQDTRQPIMQPENDFMSGPMAANMALGGSFGSSF